MENTQPPPTWNGLAFELRLHILQFLPPEDLKIMALVSRDEYAICHSRGLYRSRIIQSRIKWIPSLKWNLAPSILSDYAISFFQQSSYTNPDQFTPSDRNGWQKIVSRLKAEFKTFGQHSGKLAAQEVYIRDRGLTIKKGQELLTQSIRESEPRITQLLLAGGIPPHSEALEAAIESNELATVQTLLDAGASPTCDHLRAALEVRSTDGGRLFVTLLRSTRVTVEELVTAVEAKEAISHLSTLTQRHTYVEFIIARDDFFAGFQATLKSVEQGVGSLRSKLNAGSPLTPCLVLLLKSSHKDGDAIRLADRLISWGARVTQEVVEAALARESSACLVHLSKGVEVTPWMLERALLLIKDKKVLGILITRCSKPSQFALELAVEHAPLECIAMLAQRVTPPSKRVLVKAAFLLRKLWPPSWAAAGYQLDLLKLVSVWQPENRALMGQLLKGIDPNSEELQALLDHARRTGRLCVTREIVKACPHLGASRLRQLLQKETTDDTEALSLLRQGCPADQDLLYLAAKKSSLEIVVALRERGIRSNVHILEQALRRVPINTQIVTELVDDDLVADLKRLLPCTIQQLLGESAAKTAPQQLAQLFSLFTSRKRRSALQAPLQSIRSKRKGKERTGPPLRQRPTAKPQTTQYQLATSHKPPVILFDCFLELALQWSEEQVRVVLDSVPFSPTFYDRVAEQADRSLLEKLFRCGMPASESLLRALLERGKGALVEALLSRGNTPSQQSIIELFRDPPRPSDHELFALRKTAILSLPPAQQSELYLKIIEELAMARRGSNWDTCFQYHWIQAIKALAEMGISPSKTTLVAAISLPDQRLAMKALEALLPAWGKPMPAAVVVNAETKVTETLLKRYLKDGGEVDALLQEASRIPEMKQLLLAHLEQQGRASQEDCWFDAIQRSDEGILEIYEKYYPTKKHEPSEKLWIALARAGNTRARALALQLLLTSSPPSLPESWVAELIGNPSPHAAEVLTWAFALTAVPNTTTATLEQAVRSPLPSAPGIVDALLDHIKPPPGLLTMASTNPKQGDKIIEVLLQRGVQVSMEDCIKAPREEERRLLFHAFQAQAKGKSTSASSSIKSREVALNLWGYRLTTPQLKLLLNKFPGLQSLDLSGWKLTDKLLESVLPCCPHLKKLDLSNSQYSSKVTDQTLAAIAEHCKKLEELNLGSCKAERISLLARGCSGLRVLEFYCSDVAAEELSLLAKGCSELRILKFSGVKLDGANIRTLVSRCPKLIRLNVHSHNITSEALTSLAGTQKLEELNVRGGEVDLKSAQALASCASLKKLYVSSKLADSEWIAEFVRNNVHLIELKIEDKNWENPLNDEVLKGLSQGCPQLQILRAPHCGAYRLFPSEEHLKAFIQSHPKLRSLSVHNHTTFTGKPLRALGRGYAAAIRESMLAPSSLTSSIGWLSSVCPSFPVNTLNDIFDELPDHEPMTVLKFWSQATELLDKKNEQMNFFFEHLPDHQPQTVLEYRDQYPQTFVGRDWVPSSKVMEVSASCCREEPSLFPKIFNVVQQLGKQGVRAFVQGFSQLESLNLVSKKITRGLISKWIDAFSRVEHRLLELRFCCPISAKQIQALGKACPRLRRLYIDGWMVGPSELRALSHSFPQLTSLGFKGTKEVSLDDIHTLVRACPHLRRMVFARSNLCWTIVDEGGLKAIANGKTATLAHALWDSATAGPTGLSGWIEALTSNEMNEVFTRLPKQDTHTVRAFWQVARRLVQHKTVQHWLPSDVTFQVSKRLHEETVFLRALPGMVAAAKKQGLPKKSAQPSDPISSLLREFIFSTVNLDVEEVESLTGLEKEDLQSEHYNSSLLKELVKTLVHLDVEAVEAFTRIFSTNIFEVILPSDVSTSDKWLIALVKGAPNLQTLYIPAGSKVTSAGIQAVSQHCSKLQAFQLTSSQISDKDLQGLTSNCKQLRHLFLHYSSQITDVGLGYLSSQCPLLVTLGLSSAKGVTDSGIQQIASNCTGLAYLDLWNLGTSDVAISSLASSCRQLRKISFFGLTEITDKGLEALVQNCSHLQSIDLRSCHKIPSTFLRMIAHHCKSLESLNVRGWSGVKLDQIDEVLGGCHKLTTLNIEECGLSNEEVGLLMSTYPKVTIKHKWR